LTAADTYAQESLELPESATPATTNHYCFSPAKSGEGAESGEAWVWE